MIFGFNTDIKTDEGTYHVQSEARVSEQLLQTQVFVQGRCIAKRAVSYAELAKDPTFTEEVMHERLRQQHRWVVEAIRDGYLNDLVKSSEDSAQEPVAPEPQVKPQPQIELRFVSSARPSVDSILLCFEVKIAGVALQGAAVRAHIAPTGGDGNAMGDGAAVGETDESGTVKLSLEVPPGAHGEANLVVQATHESLKTVKRFLLRAASN